MLPYDKLFTPARRTELANAVPDRFSCRTFAGEISLADWSTLTYLAGRYTLPGVRLALTHADDGLFTGMLLGPGRVTGCRAVFAVYIDTFIPNAALNAGFAGEALCLELTVLGLASCWLTGTFRRAQLEGGARRDEQLLGIIALGRPAEQAGSRRRKQLDRICRSAPDAWRAEYRRAAELVRLAPSAMNMQPWALAEENDTLCLDGSDRAQLDLGIAMCHAELALTMPHAWVIGRLRTEPRLRAVPK